MRTVCLLCAVVLLACGTVSAQESMPADAARVAAMDDAQTVDVRGGEFRRHELSFGYGLGTAPQFANILAEIITFTLVRSDLVFSGAGSVDYYYYPIKHIGVGGTLVYEHGRSLSDSNYKSSHNYITLMPSAKFYWFNRPYVGMYSRIGVGATYVCGSYNGTFEQWWMPAFQLSAIALEVGGRVRGFVELGYGTAGTLQVGMKVKFK